MKVSLQKAERNIQNAVILNQGRPTCFDSVKEYTGWLEAEQVCHTQAFRKNICEDCTIDFKNLMVHNRRCCNLGVRIKD